MSVGDAGGYVGVALLLASVFTARASPWRGIDEWRSMQPERWEYSPFRRV